MMHEAKQMGRAPGSAGSDDAAHVINGMVRICIECGGVLASRDGRAWCGRCNLKFIVEAA